MYKVTNEAGVTRAYYNEYGTRVKFDAGETKTLKSLPPSGESGWTVVEETETSSDDSSEGGEN